jgi:group I intron endonuclease
MEKQDNAIIGIYKITSPSGKIYIGQSINILKTWKHRYNNLNDRLKKQPKIYNSLLKYGPEAHKFEIIEECLIEELDNKESYYKLLYINEYGWDKALFCEIYDTNKGGFKSKETCDKIGKAHKGKLISYETKQKMRIAKIGNKQSEKVCLLRSNKMKGNTFNIGKKHSLETKQKISASLKGKPKKKGYKLTEEHKQKLSESIKKSKALGKAKIGN